MILPALPPANYYVDINHPSANDNNSGTAEDEPWETISQAAATLVAGETVYVKDGSYFADPGISGCNWTTPAFNPANSGTVGNPITFAAYPGHKPYTFNNTGPSDPGCPTIGSNRRDFITWSGFEVVTGGTKAVMLNNCNNVIITLCEVHGMRGENGANTDAIRADQPVDCTFSHNTIYDVDDGDVPRGCGASGLKMYDAVRCIIEHNHVYDVGCGLRQKAGTARDNIFRYNWVHDCTRAGIHFGVGDGTFDMEAYNNIVARCKNGVDIDGNSNPAQRHKVYNNTFIDCSREAVNCQAAQIVDTEAWNNICVDSGVEDLQSNNASLAFADWNLFFGNLPNPESGTNNVIGDPLFVGV